MMIKELDPNCTKTTFLSNLLICVKNNYDLDKLYDIALQKDFTNSYWKNYKDTYPNKCQNQSTESANQVPSRGELRPIG